MILLYICIFFFMFFSIMVYLRILNGLPWKWTEIILSFLRLHASIEFQTLSLTTVATPFLLRDSCPFAKLLQSCPTLCNPIDGSPPGSTIPGILQARTLEWVAISFSNAWKWKVKVKLLSRVWLLASPWTAAHQAPPSMGFSRQENGSSSWYNGH